MPTIVSLKLRADAGNDEAPYEDVDLDALSPRARALAEAFAQTDLRSKGTIWLERTHVTEEVARPERRWWNGWGHYPYDSSVSAADYLEREARKFSSGWHVYGVSADRPVPSRAAAAADAHLTRDAAMRRLGLSPAGWDTLRRVKHLPAPDRYIDRHPEWLPATIDAYANRPREQWTLSQVAEHMGYEKGAARGQMSRWGLPAEGRAPGRGGENLYAGDWVEAVHAARPGRGRWAESRSE
jgi:hypothetical protein